MSDELNLYDEDGIKVTELFLSQLYTLQIDNEKYQNVYIIKDERESEYLDRYYFLIHDTQNDGKQLLAHATESGLSGDPLILRIPSSADRKAFKEQHLKANATNPAAAEASPPAATTAEPPAPTTEPTASSAEVAEPVSKTRLYNRDSDIEATYLSDGLFYTLDTGSTRVDVTARYDSIADTGGFFIVNADHQTLSAYATQNGNTIDVVAASEGEHLNYAEFKKAEREKEKQAAAEASSPAATTAEPSSETFVVEVDEDKSIKTSIKLKDVTHYNLEVGKRYILRSDREDQPVTWALGEEGGSVFGYFKGRDDAEDKDKVYYQATKDAEGKLEWTKKEPEKAAEAATEEKIGWKYESDVGFVADTAFQVIGKALTQSKTTRGTGEIYKDQSWGAPLNAIANKGRDITYGATDNLANSALVLTVVGAALSFATPIGYVALAAGSAGGLIKLARTANEARQEGGLLTAVKNNTSKIDMVAMSGTAVVGILAGAVAAPSVAIALAVVGSVMGAGYAMEKIGENVMKGISSTAENVSQKVEGSRTSLANARQEAKAREQGSQRG